jgi:HEAT repeat protein
VKPATGANLVFKIRRIILIGVVNSVTVMARAFRTDTRIALLVSVVVLTGAACSGISHAAEDTAHLLQQLHDQDVQKQRDAAKALSNIEPVSSETLQTMITIVEATGGDNQVRDYAQSAICNAGTAAIPTLQRWVLTGGFLRQIGVNLLGCLAPKTPAVWSILIDIYKKNRYADAMTGLASVGKPVLPLLFDQLRGSDPEMRKGALRAIDIMVGWSQMSAEGRHWYKNSIEPKDLDPVLSELTGALKDSDPVTQGYAAFAVHYADPTDLRVLPIFIRLVMEDGSSAGSAIAALQEMGPAAKPAIPALEHALAKDQQSYNRAPAGQALTQIEGVGACSAVEKALAHDPDNQGNLLHTILGIKPPCPNLTQVLIANLGEQPPSDSVGPLSKIGAAAVPALASALKSSNLYVRQNASEALAGMKPIPPDAIQALTAALKDPNSDVRSSATNALLHVGGEAQKAAEAAQKNEAPPVDKLPGPDDRLCGAEQMDAVIPADSDHEYPSQLVYKVPLANRSGLNTPLIITVHAGQDRSDRLVVWKKVAPDQYKQEQVVYSDPEEDGTGIHFGRPSIFKANYERISDSGVTEESGFFLEISSSDDFHYHNIDFYEIDNDRLVLLPASGEYGGAYLDGGTMKFFEPIYNRSDPSCCYSGGAIIGTYKLVEDAKQNPSQWKFVVATKKQMPPGWQPN